MHFDTFIDQFWTYTVTGLTVGSIYALVALGYTLVYGVLRLINFAHSEIFMVGSFGAIFSAKWLGIGALDDPKSGLALVGVLLFAAVVSMVFSGGAAVLLERVAYRPLRGSGDIYGAIALAFISAFVIAYILPPDNGAADLVTALVLTGPITLWYRRLLGRGRQATRLAFLISAIGASLAISEAFALWRGRNLEQYPRVLERSKLFGFFDADVRTDQVIVIVGALLMMLALDLFVGRTRLGRGIRAVAQDAETARLMGVNVDNVIMITFLLGGIMAGGASFLFVMFYENTKYNIGYLLGVKAFTAAVLGGIGNLRGALLGGLLLGLVENYGAALTNTKWKDVIAFVVLLVVLMFRPTGLLGEKLREGPGMTEFEDRLAERMGGLGRALRVRFELLGRRWHALPVRIRALAAVAGVVVLYALPYAADVSFLDFVEPKNSDFVGVLFYPMSIYVLVAVGLNLVVGETGLLDLGYVAFFAVGAYTTGVLGSLHGDLPWIALLPLGVVFALVAGVLLGIPTLRLRGDYLAIVTLGFGEIIRITANNLEWLGDARGISNIPKPPNVGPIEFKLLDAKPYYWLSVTLIIIVVIGIRSVERSRVGRYWNAIREDEDAAELMGVPTFQYKLWAFASGAALGGLSGVLFASRVRFINPDSFPLELSILFLAAVVLGGAGNLPGVIIGAAVVAYLPERFRFLEERRVFFFGIALVLMMIFRPQGLLPRKIRGSRTYAGDGSPPTAGASAPEGLT